MLAAAARFLPAISNYARQIVPPVVATLIAAVLIAGYNRAFTGHLVQPRMAAMHSGEAVAGEVPRTAAAKPREVTDAVVVAEPINVHNRVFSKDTDREAAKDDLALKTAALPAAEPAIETTMPAASPAPTIAQPAPATAPTPPLVRAPKKAEPRVVERRPVEQRPYGAPVIVSQPPVIVAQPPVAAPGPMIATAPVVVQQAPYPAQQQAAPYPMQQPVAQEPPPVIAAKPMVTVPDRQRAPYQQTAPQSAPYAQHAPYETAATPAQETAPPPPQGGPLERFVDTMKPSSIFARMRELGDKIEAVGNDILPTLRQ